MLTCGTRELAVIVLSCDVIRHTSSLKQFCAQQTVVLNLSAVKKKSTKSFVFTKKRRKKKRSLNLFCIVTKTFYDKAREAPDLSVSTL